METIPFAPLPLPIMRKIVHPFDGIGFRITRMFPALKTDLMTAGMHILPEVYGAVMAFSFLIYFILFSILVTIFLGKFVFATIKIGSITIPQTLLLGIIIGFILACLIFLQMLTYPQIRTKKRVRDIERNLVFALRTILVEIRSGVSLFDALYMISSTNRYGQLSKEFKGAVDSISTGISEDVALEELATKNPSPHLRKTLWQIVNGMKAGADVSDVLSESVDSIMREQQIDIQKYGNNLKVLSLVYLMLGVIIPALGLTFLIVIGSFPRIKITEIIFWGLLGAIILAEFMFIGIMKSKRPNLMSE
jgi:flagellar protein FlaJ